MLEETLRRRVGESADIITRRRLEVLLPLLMSRCWLCVLLRVLCTLFKFSFLCFMLEPRVMAWNCRGAGSKAFLRYLNFLLVKYKHYVLILLETKVDSSAVQQILTRTCMSNFCVLEANR